MKNARQKGPGGSKLKAWALEACTALLGAMCPQSGRQERGLGGSRNSFGGLRPAPRGQQLIDFRVPGGSPEGSEGGSGSYFRTLLDHAARGSKKQANLSEKQALKAIQKCACS